MYPLILLKLKVQRQKQRVLFSICLLSSAICLLFISSCNTNNSASQQTVFNINLDEGLTSLDPAFCRNQNTTWMDNQLYNGLVQIDDSLHIKPCIAKSWDISANGLQYTFHLRNDVYFHADPLFQVGAGLKPVASFFVYSLARLII